MIDWQEIADILDIELDEDGKFATFEDWVRAGAYAFKDDDDIHITTPDRLVEILEV